MRPPASILLSLSLVAGTACAQESSAPAKPVAVDFVRTTGFTYGPWRSSVMGGGGYVQNVVPCPSNPKRFYTYVDVGGLSRSDDGGQSWRMLHGALPAGFAHVEVRGLIVDPRDDNKITVATGSPYGKGGGVFVSTDAGTTFRKVLEAQYAGNGGSRSQGFILARDARNPDRLVTAAINDGVFLSTDNGETWTPAGAKGLYPTDVRFDRSNPDRIWLCASGEKWADTPHKRGFYRTEDSGATWEMLGDADTPSEIVQDPKNPGELFGIVNATLIKKSTDAGKTWTDFSDGLPFEAVTPGSYKESISPTGYRALTTGPDFILTATTKGGQFFKLPSGGTKWEKLEGRQTPEDGDWFHHGGGTFGWAMGSITIDPHDPAHWFITDYFAIYQSHDAGRTWRLTIDGMETTVAHCAQQDPSDPGVVHVGVADVGAFSSTDGGVRLHRGEVPNLGPDRNGAGNMKCLDLSPKLPNRLYGVANRNYYMGWRADQVYVSIDRGGSWHRSPMSGLPDLAKNPATTIVADLNDPYTAYVTVSGKLGAPGGVYKSADGGASWSPMNDGLPAGEYCFPYDIWAHGRQLAAGPDGTLIALNISGNRIYRFDTKSRKWETAPVRGKGGRLWSVAADRLKAGRFFVGVRGDGLYRTEDGGLTWKRVYDKGVSFVATDGAVAGRVAGGTPEGVILSTDGGDTWTLLDQRLPYRHDNIPAFAGERLVVGSSGNGVFWMPLSSKGLRSVVAKPVVPATLPSPAKPIPSFNDGGFESPALESWTLEQKTGAARVERDTSARRQGKASVKISMQETASGQFFQDIKATRRLFSVAFVVRAEGALKKAQVVLTSYDAKNQPLGALMLATIRPGAKSWKEFLQSVALPRAAVRFRVSVEFEGAGQISLDDFKTQALVPVFPE